MDLVRRNSLSLAVLELFLKAVKLAWREGKEPSPRIWRGGRGSIPGRYFFHSREELGLFSPSVALWLPRDWCAACACQVCWTTSELCHEESTGRVVGVCSEVRWQEEFQ